MSEQLKPCPFCGSEATINNPWEKSFTVLCEYSECPVNPEVFRHVKQQAIIDWNTRLLSKDRELLILQ